MHYACGLTRRSCCAEEIQARYRYTDSLLARVSARGLLKDIRTVAVSNRTGENCWGKLTGTMSLGRTDAVDRA